MVIDKNNSLWIWDINTYEPVRMMEDVRIATGFDHKMAITNDGVLWGWGGTA